MAVKWLDKLLHQHQGCVCHSAMTNLSEAKSGEQFRIECLSGEAGVCERLREMGFCESSVVEKVADSGALICKVCDAKVVLSKGLAKNVIVKHVCHCEGHAMNEKKIVLLSQMSAGQKGVIEELSMDNEGYERIQEMGVTPGEVIEVVRFAPLGDPVEVKIRGYNLSLRKQEADLIKVNI